MLLGLRGGGVAMLHGLLLNNMLSRCRCLLSYVLTEIMLFSDALFERSSRRCEEHRLRGLGQPVGRPHSEGSRRRVSSDPGT